MTEIIDYLHDFNYVTTAIRILLAILAGGIIGIERGKHGSAAGLRTHILVCVGAVMTALTGMFIFNELEIYGDVTRISAQVISGIGFLGAGMIIVKNGNFIIGLTTAAGMWATAAIGIALGFGFYSGAVIATFACVFTAAFLSRLESKRKEITHIYAEINLDKKINNILDEIRDKFDTDALIEAVTPKSNVENTIGVYITLSNIHTVDEIKNHIDNIDGIVFWILE